MIPEGRLSTTVQYAPYYSPDDLEPPNALTDYEYGGPGLNDATGGLRQKIWTARADGETGEVFVSAPDVAETLVFTAPGITRLSLAFDQNMRPFIAFTQNGQAKFRWYDTVLGANRITDLDPGDRNPCCTMDDKRNNATDLGQNDIILAYTRNGNLYYRQQRDRFDDEYLLATGLTARLLRVGMNSSRRLQFMLEEVVQ